MSTQRTLHDAAPRPRTARVIPRYPRQLAMVGVALAMAGCMGAAPSPYGPGPTQPEQQVLVPAGEADDSNAFAEPPPEEVPVVEEQPVVEPEPELQPPGVAPVPYP